MTPDKQLRATYVNPNYEGTVYCLGTKKDCWAQANKGAKVLAFGKAFTEDSPISVIMKPDMKKVQRCKSLDFLPAHIHYLKIPLPLVKFLTDEERNHRLFTLNIENKEQYMDEGLLSHDVDSISDLSFPHLKALLFTGNSELASVFWSNLPFSSEQFPQLVYIDTMLEGDDSTTILEKIHTFPHLEYISLNGIKNAPVLSHIRQDQTKSLFLGETKAAFDFQQLKDFPKLELLSIRESKAIFDCAYISELPALTELLLIGVKKVLNVEQLLEMKSLKYLTIMDSGGPIKKKMKPLFLEYGFEELDIEFA